MEKYPDKDFYCEKCHNIYPIPSKESHISICGIEKICPFCRRRINLSNYYDHILSHELENENEEIQDEFNYNNNNYKLNINQYPSKFHFLNDNENEKYEPEVKRINSKIVKVGENEFYDLEEEANEIKYKKLEEEAYEKKILGLKKGKNTSFGRKVKNYFKEHKNEIFEVTLDLIGCAFLIPECVGDLTEKIISSIKNRNEKKKEEENDLIKPSQIIDFLPITTLGKRYNSEIEFKCIICYDDLKEGDQITTLPCIHVFHFDCIKAWIYDKGNCPICKFTITKSCLLGEI